MYYYHINWILRNKLRQATSRPEPKAGDGQEVESEGERLKKAEGGGGNKGSLFVLFCSEKEGREALPF